MTALDRWVTTIAASGSDDPTLTIGTPTRGSGTRDVVRRLSDGVDGDLGAALELGAEIARGGLGTIHIARQRSLSREVAVKRLRCDDNEARIAFATEVAITAGLEHPGVVPVHLAGPGFMAMKRIRGRSLGQLMAAAGPGAPVELVEHLVELCHALAYAHDRGVVHRDLKPANLMVGEYGEVYLIDWGLALATADGPPGIPRVGESDNLCAGSPAYLAPEAARAEATAIGPATDCFGLGAILFELLAGRPPVPGTSLRDAVANAAAGRHRSLPEAALAAHAPLAALCTRLLDPDPLRRGSLAQARAELEGWIAASNRRAAAATELERARTAAGRAHTATEPATIFAQLELAHDACRLALGLDPEREDARALGAQVLAEAVAHALDGGDHLLARALAVELPAEARARAEAAVAAATLRRRRARRLTRLSAWLGLASVFALIAGAIAWTALGRADHQRDLAEQRAHAQALVAGLPPPPGSDAAQHRAAERRLQQASGTHPEPALLHPLLVTCAEAAARDALAEDDLPRAAHHLARLRELDAAAAPALHHALATAEARAAEAREHERTARNTAIETMIAAVAAPDRAAHALESEAARLADWCRGEDGAWATQRVRALLADLRPAARRLGIATLAAQHHQNPTASDLESGLLAPLIADPEPAVAAEAALALVRCDAAGEPGPVLAALLGFAQPATRTRALTTAETWLRRRIDAGSKQALAADPGPERSAVLRRWATLCHRIDWGSKQQELLAAAGSEVAQRHRDLRVADRRGDLAAVERSARSLIESHDCPTAYLLLAEHYRRAERYADVVELTAAVARAGHPDLLGQLAAAQRALGQDEAARTTLGHATSAAIHGRFTDGRGLDLAVVAAIRLDLPDAAVAIAAARARREPEERRPAYIHAWALQRVGRHAEAIAVCEAAMLRWPRRDEFYTVQAEAELARGEHRAAIATARRGLEATGENAGLLALHGEALERDGQLVEALRSLLAASDLPDAPRSIYQRGEVLARQLGYEGSVLDLRLAAARSREGSASTRYRLLIGLIEHGAGRLALDELERFPAEGAALRHAFNRLCYASPALRRAGWPTIEPPILVEWLLWDAICLLQLPGAIDPARVAAGRAFLAAADGHPLSPTHERVHSLLAAWYDGDRDGARAAAEAILAFATEADEGWVTRLARALLELDPTGPAPQPLPVWEHWLPDVPPLRPLFAPEDRDRLRVWFDANHERFLEQAVDPAFLDRIGIDGRHRDPASIQALILELPHLDQGVSQP